ncbi:GNAT family N-acetyltransferase [Galbibacter sp. PAP.153]|uniref:GNAT family N-acetyltransferase n=1 Tax=Galbibacter sp. PAP.153 TaxID=3104623 RepID=UPI00300BD8EA
MNEIKVITSAEAHKVRHPVLREGKPFETAIFPEDDLKDTFHVGCVLENEPIGTVTFMQKGKEEFKAVNPYQLRGMAVLQNHQKKGLGDLMVKKGEELVKKHNGDLIWLNAREIAVGFYKKIGYQVHGGAFMVAGIGPHYLMYKTLI